MSGKQCKRSHAQESDAEKLVSRCRCRDVVKVRMAYAAKQYGNGVSMCAIGRELGYSVDTVSHWLGTRRVAAWRGWQ